MKVIHRTPTLRFGSIFADLKDAVKKLDEAGIPINAQISISANSTGGSVEAEWETESKEPVDLSNRDFLELLSGIEWYQAPSNHAPSCPECGNYEHEGHSADCSLRKTIRNLTAKLGVE